MFTIINCLIKEDKKNQNSQWGEPPYYCEICGKPGHWSGWELHGPQALCWWHDLLQFTDTNTYLFLAFVLTVVLIIVPFISFWIKVSLILFLFIGWKNPWRFLK